MKRGRCLTRPRRLRLPTVITIREVIMKKLTAIRSAVAGAIAGAMLLGLAAAPVSAEMKAKNFRVVGTWGFLDHWKEREGPFWKKH